MRMLYIFEKNESMLDVSKKVFSLVLPRHRFGSCFFLDEHLWSRHLPKLLLHCCFII